MSSAANLSRCSGYASCDINGLRDTQIGASTCSAARHTFSRYDRQCLLLSRRPARVSALGFLSYILEMPTGYE